MGKRTFKQLFASRWVTGLSLVIVVFLAVAYVRAYWQNYHIEQEIKRLQQEASRLESKKIETIQLLDYVKSPAYVEEKARTELNLVKDGEQMAIIKQSENSNGQPEKNMVESSQLSNPRKWWNYFLHS